MFWIVLVVHLSLVNSQGWFQFDCQDSAGKDNGICEGVSFEISGGTTADDTRFPYLISLQQQLQTEKRFNHYCGGILIQDDLVLTVAHCLFRKNMVTNQIDYDMRTNSGASQGLLNSSYDIQAAQSPSCRHLAGRGRRKVSQYWIHPKYDGYSIHGNDIAILKLIVGFEYNGIKPRFDYEQQANLNSSSLTVLGWGATNELETDPLYASAIVKNLQEALVQHNSLEDCQAEAEAVNGTFQIIDGQMLCFQNPESDTCTGDSGGPVLIKDCSQSDVVVGLTSWGIDSNCSGQGFSGVYTDISGYKVWIEKVVQEANLQGKNLVNGFPKPSIKNLAQNESTNQSSPQQLIVSESIYGNDIPVTSIGPPGGSQTNLLVPDSP